MDASGLPSSRYQNHCLLSWFCTVVGVFCTDQLYIPCWLAGLMNANELPSVSVICAGLCETTPIRASPSAASLYEKTVRIGKYLFPFIGFFRFSGSSMSSSEYPGGKAVKAFFNFFS